MERKEVTMKRVVPYSATQKLQELNRLELGTLSFCILFDCGRNRALHLKREVMKKIEESGKICPYPDKVPTASAIKYLGIDEARIRRLAEQEKKDASI